MLETLTHFLQEIVAGVAEICIPIVQLVGVVILMLSAIRGVIDYAQRKPHVGVTLAHGLARGEAAAVGGFAGGVEGAGKHGGVGAGRGLDEQEIGWHRAAAKGFGGGLGYVERREFLHEIGAFE